jgi:hypothetical protein
MVTAEHRYLVSMAILTLLRTGLFGDAATITTEVWKAVSAVRPFHDWR